MRSVRKKIISILKKPTPVSRGLTRVALSSYCTYDSLFLKRASRPDLKSEKVVLPAYKLLYVAVPKSMTRSMLKQLSKLGDQRGGHTIFEDSLPRLFGKYPEAEDYYTFTVVRNPWSRIASCYKDKIAICKPFMQARIINGRPGLRAGMSFQEFVEWLCGDYGSDDFADRHWLSQSRIMEIEKREYNRIGKIENTEEFISSINADLGDSVFSTPRRENSKGEYNYRELYDDRTIALVQKRYEEDIDRFKYCF